MALSQLSIGLFAKYPQLGKVKTRLVPLLGEQGAVDFARYLIVSQAERLLLPLYQQGVVVWLWRDGGSDAQWQQLLAGLPAGLAQNLRLAWQSEGNLGQRMQFAMQQQLSGSDDRALLVCADAIEMTDVHAFEIFEALNQVDLVFTPAHDGGYVAVGARRLALPTFAADIPWGGSQVLEKSMTVAEQMGLKVTTCLAQMDIDEPEDFLAAQEKNLFPKDWKSVFN